MNRTPSSAGPLITVLGASGFVGAAVVRALARRPVRVRAVARNPVVPAAPPAGAAGPAAISAVAADLTDRAALAAAVSGSDAVLHLLLGDGGWRAAETDRGAARVNVGVMRDLVEVIGAGDRATAPLVVYAGAASQVGVPPREPLDGREPDRPETAYDRQKLTAERLLLAATAEGRVRGISLRLPTVFGESALPGTDGNSATGSGTGCPAGSGATGRGHADRGVVSAMARRALAGEPLTMWHDGTVRRDLVHVTDAAAAFTAALDHPDRLVGGHWLVGSGRGDALGDVFRLVARAVAERTGRPPVAVVSVAPPAGAPVTDFRSVTVDAAAFRAATGWRPRVALAEGVRRTVTALHTALHAAGGTPTGDFPTGDFPAGAAGRPYTPADGEAAR